MWTCPECGRTFKKCLRPNSLALARMEEYYGKSEDISDGIFKSIPSACQ